jgi:hypothetical protein
MEEAITQLNEVIQKTACSATSKTNLKLNIHTIHGNSRTQLRKNENSEEDGRRDNILKINIYIYIYIK